MSVTRNTMIKNGMTIKNITTIEKKEHKLSDNEAPKFFSGSEMKNNDRIPTFLTQSQTFQPYVQEKPISIHIWKYKNHMLNDSNLELDSQIRTEMNHFAV